MEAKDADAEKFQSGIDKLFTFKSQVKDLLVENKKQMATDKEEKEALKVLLEEKNQIIERLQKDT